MLVVENGYNIFVSAFDGFKVTFSIMLTKFTLTCNVWDLYFPLLGRNI